MINNFHFSKNFRENKKYRNNSYDNSYEIFVTDGNKSNFFLESQVTINDGKKKIKKIKTIIILIIIKVINQLRQQIIQLHI